MDWREKADSALPITKGARVIDAALEAARIRLRPILMTSLAFIFGVVPLMLAQGASKETQQAIGTGVFGGMVSATVLAVFFVPVFYVVVQGARQWIAPSTGCATSSSAASTG